MNDVATAQEQKFAFQLDEFYLDLQEDGRKIRVLPQDEIAAMPYPGLRPFKTSEFQLFKGRTGQALELVKRLETNRFLAVIGSSGTGKSSLVRAGLLPELYGGSLHGAGGKWNIAVCRPGKNPIANLAVALSSIKARANEGASLAETYKEVDELLNSSIYGLLKVNKLLNEDAAVESETNLLVIVDQFEELFRYNRQNLGRENIESQFVDLLLKAAANTKSPVYVVITMRSEFLGDCVKYRELPEAINKGQYLVPGLGRNQLKDVIEGPVHLAGKSIEPGLVELLINEIEQNKLKENLDQLPILQHALMRTYQEAVRQNATVINYEHYKAIGGMAKALAKHADEKFNGLNEGAAGGPLSKKQGVAKIIFQALTDASTGIKGGRRPVELGIIYAIAEADGIKATPADVNEVVNRFRDENTSFLMPPTTPLHPQLIMDISHESLMRNWDRLKEWVEEEAQNGRIYRRLNTRREDGETVIQQGPLLGALLKWRDEFPHNAAWASRYQKVPTGNTDPGVHKNLYSQNINLLKGSEEKIKAEVRNKERAKNIRLKIYAGVALGAVLFGIYAFTEVNYVNKQKLTIENGSKMLASVNDSLQMQRQRADSLTEAALASKNDAVSAKDSALMLLNENKRLTNSIILEQTQKKLAKNLAELAVLQRERIKRELETHIVKTYLQNQPFYTSSLLSNNTKDSILAALFKGAPPAEVIINYAGYIYSDVLSGVNNTVDARRMFTENAVEGLRMAQKTWTSNQSNKWMENMFLDIFRETIFNAQKIAPLVYQSTATIEAPQLLSVNGNQFAFATRNQIVSGNYGENGLHIKDITTSNAAFNQAKGRSFGNDDSDFSATSLIAQALINNSSLLSLLDNDVIVQTTVDEKKQVGKILDAYSVSLAEFAPTGEWLVTYSSDDTVKLWHLPDMKPWETSVAKNLSNNPKNKNIRQFIFSPDGQNLLITYKTDQFEVWDLKTLKRSEKLNRYPYGQAANFSSDGNFLLVGVSDRNVRVYDGDGKVNSSLILPASTDNHNAASRITDLSLSVDKKSLLIKNENAAIVYRNDAGIPLVRQNEKANVALKPAKLFSFQEGITNAKFLNSDAVIGLTDAGNTYIWNINNSPQNLNEAFGEVRNITAQTYWEKDKVGDLDFAQILSSSTKEDLRNAGQYYFQKAVSYNDYDTAGKQQTIERAKTVYNKLAAVDTAYMKAVDLRKLYALSNIPKSSQDLSNASPDSQDTLSRIRVLTNSIQSGEKVLKNDAKDGYLKEQLSTDYWTLSWLMLFQNKYDTAIAYANRGFELYKKNDGVKANVALGYLLSGKYADAERVYTEYKDKVYSSVSQTPFKTAFLKDFADAEYYGLIPKGSDVEKKATYIKNVILGGK